MSEVGWIKGSMDMLAEEITTVKKAIGNDLNAMVASFKEELVKLSREKEGLEEQVNLMKSLLVGQDGCSQLVRLDDRIKALED